MASEFQRQVFGKTLRDALEDSRMSQRALARAVGVSPNAVSQWVHGKAVPQAEMVTAIERTLRLEAETLGRLIGYVPAAIEEQARRSVVEAIHADPRLGEREQDLLVTMYRKLAQGLEPTQDQPTPTEQTEDLPDEARERMRELEESIEKHDRDLAALQRQLEKEEPTGQADAR